MPTLTARKATLSDLPAIVNWLIEDELGQTREKVGDIIDQRYLNAFQRIDADSNQYLMVVVNPECVFRSGRTANTVSLEQ